MRCVPHCRHLMRWTRLQSGREIPDGCSQTGWFDSLGPSCRVGGLVSWDSCAIIPVTQISRSDQKENDSCEPALRPPPRCSSVSTLRRCPSSRLAANEDTAALGHPISDSGRHQTHGSIGGLEKNLSIQTRVGEQGGRALSNSRHDVDSNVRAVQR
jgi:hypothetical protein